MLPKLPAALKSSLPLLLIASPLLLGAARQMDSESYQFPCNVPAAEGSVPVSDGQGQNNYSQEAAGEITAEDAAAFASVGGPSLGERWAITLRLLISNRYTQEDSPAAGITNTPATAPTENNCLAQQQEPSNETLLAQAVPTSSKPLTIAQEPDLLPVLGAPPVNSIPANPIPAPVPTRLPAPTPATPLPTVRPLPRPDPAPANLPILTAPISQPTPANDNIPAGFPGDRSSSIDPTNITPTRVYPTLFDGGTLQTLAARPDGNYRYVAGDVESRAYTDAEIQQSGRSVFVLRKEGNRVTGNLSSRLGQPGICMTGIVSGDMISGSAYPYSSLEAARPAGGSIRDENFEVYGSGVFQVMQPEKIKIGEQESIYYASAVLNLSSFSTINAGSSLPPKSCRATPTRESVQN